ncbi:MAG: replication factor C large subunit [Haloferacaceae archaeon]
MMDWTEKHRPSTLAEVRGNDKARDALREWAETWDDHREAVVLHGAPGVGKTSAAHALANDMGWETVELNASDRRTADEIDRFAGRAARNATLGGAASGDDGRQLVIVDEADNLHGTRDRGGAGAITDLATEADQPVVLIANDYYELSRGLRSATREIEFRDVSARSIVPVLRDVCRREGIEFEEAALERIAEADSGDLRAAVRDLQAAAEGRDRVTVDDVAAGDRDRTLGIFEFLDRVLKEDDPEAALRAAYDTDETPDDLVQWVEHNLPKVYEGRELARAYDHLADADRWLGRVVASDFDFSWWRYATDGLAAGVAAARDGSKGGWTRFDRPQFWSSTDATTESVVRAVARANGTSMATARREILPVLSALTHHCKPRELTVAMAAAYGFEEAEVALVTGSGESTDKVESIVADARERREAAAVEGGGGAFAPDERAAREGEAADASGDADATAAPADGGAGDPADGDGDDGEPDLSDRADGAGDDDGQSGLDEFM